VDVVVVRSSSAARASSHCPVPCCQDINRRLLQWTIVTGLGNRQKNIFAERRTRQLVIEFLETTGPGLAGIL